MRHATECGERDVMRFVRETAGCLVEKDIELRGAVEDLDRRIKEIRLQIVMLSGKKEGGPVNDGLFSMEEKREGNDGKAMVSFMVPAALKNELQERARQLHTTATRLMAEAIQLRLRKNDGANDMDRIGADEFVKSNAIRTLIAARLTGESPAQAWVIAYRAGWNDALDFCIQAEQALDKEEDK